MAGFDAAICRMALMLFPSPGEAAQAVRHALKPSGRFAGLVFTLPAGKRFMAEPMAILLRHAGKSPPALGLPGIFALGGEGFLERLMRDSGLAGVEVETVRAPLVLPSPSDAMQLMPEAAGHTERWWRSSTRKRNPRHGAMSGGVEAVRVWGPLATELDFFIRLGHQITGEYRSVIPILPSKGVSQHSVEGHNARASVKSAA